MNALHIRNRYFLMFTPYGKFRIYDCLQRGYIVMLHTGERVGIADSIVQAQQIVRLYRGR